MGLFSLEVSAVTVPPHSPEPTALFLCGDSGDTCGRREGRRHAFLLLCPILPLVWVKHPGGEVGHVSLKVPRSTVHSTWRLSNLHLFTSIHAKLAPPLHPGGGDVVFFKPGNWEPHRRSAGWLTPRTCPGPDSVQLSAMEKRVSASTRRTVAPFQKGQVWRVGDFHLVVTAVGKTLVHYKQYKVNPKMQPTRLSSTDDLQKRLLSSKAVLVS